jgi:diacylglycerol O-acyltransferase
MQRRGGMSADREPLRAVDAAWLRMDSPTNAMVINALLVFRAAPGIERIRALVNERLLAHRRFRQRVFEPALGLPHWELDPQFDVRAHLHHIALPAPGDQGSPRGAGQRSGQRTRSIEPSPSGRRT